MLCPFPEGNLEGKRVMLTKVFGCGNSYIYNDGVGSEVLKRLRKTDVEDFGAEFLEASLDPFVLLEKIRGSDKIILIDAVQAAGVPGTIYRFTLDDVDFSFNNSLSVHNVGINDIIKLGKKIYEGEMPGEIVIIGVEVGDEAYLSNQCSPVVEKAFPELTELVLRELGIGKKTAVNSFYPDQRGTKEELT